MSLIEWAMAWLALAGLILIWWNSFVRRGHR